MVYLGLAYSVAFLSVLLLVLPPLPFLPRFFFESPSSLPQLPLDANNWYSESLPTDPPNFFLLIRASFGSVPDLNPPWCSRSTPPRQSRLGVLAPPTDSQSAAATT